MKKAWHVTTAIHNSRYSKRLFAYKIKTAAAIWLSEKDEIILTKTIADIVKNDNLNVVEYNICGDHMHLLLVCEKEKLSKIVGKIKAVSSRKCNTTRGHVPLEGISSPGNSNPQRVVPLSRHVPLSEGISSLGNSNPHRVVPLPDTGSGTRTKKKYNALWTQKFGRSEIKTETYLNNTIKYIRNNRIKHKLPKSEEIEKIKKEFLCTKEHAFRTEYNARQT